MKGTRMRQAQVSIFVIVAIVIAMMLAVGMVAWRSGISGGERADADQAFEFYEACIAEETRDALALAGTQGGHVSPPSFIPGSDYAPFSSQLDFLGFPVPYWLYVSGNGVLKEQVPRKTDIEAGVREYLTAAVRTCDFSAFSDRGVEVQRGEPRVAVSIGEQEVTVRVDEVLVVSSAEGSGRRAKHEVRVPSSFGALYRQALSVYEHERTSAFLENYSRDVLFLYAPVDGVEAGCAPRVWKTREVVAGLQEGLAANMAAVKLKGDYYTLQAEENEYFVVDRRIDDQVRFLYNPSWPSSIDIAGARQETMIAEPVGIQPGLGVLGFCYAPYHFVYDLRYPVLVQVMRDEEVFQFPIVVMIENNVPRQPLPGSFEEGEAREDLCSLATQPLQVEVRDVLLKPVDGAEVSYSCFDQTCPVGTTAGGRAEGLVPGCVNGYVSVKAEGYAPQRQVVTSVAEGSTTLIVDRLYPLALSLEVGGGDARDVGLAVVAFEGPEAVHVAYPAVQNVSLPEGQYNITVYVYGNSSVTIPESTSRECTNVPRAGFAGLFGGTREQCFDIALPETKIDIALVGGGSVSVYLLPAELEKGTLAIKVPALPVPRTLAELQTNYEVFSLQRAEVTLHS